MANPEPCTGLRRRPHLFVDRPLTFIYPGFEHVAQFPTQNTKSLPRLAPSQRVPVALGIQSHRSPGLVNQKPWRFFQGREPHVVLFGSALDIFKRKPKGKPQFVGCQPLWRISRRDDRANQGKQDWKANCRACWQGKQAKVLVHQQPARDTPFSWTILTSWLLRGFARKA